MTAFDRASGRELWSTSPDQEALASKLGPPDRAEGYGADVVLKAPAVADDRVFVHVETNGLDALVALDAQSGRPAWTFQPVQVALRSGLADVAVARGIAAVPSVTDRQLVLHGVDARDGTARWATSLGEVSFTQADLGPFIVADDRGFLLGLNGAVVAVNADDGSVRFRLDLPRDTVGGQVWYAAPTLYHRRGLASIDAYDAGTGALRWTSTTDLVSTAGAPRAFRADERHVFVLCDCRAAHPGDWGSRWGQLLALDAQDGRERWRVPLDVAYELHQDPPAIGSEVVLVAGEDDAVVARSVTDGAVRWRLARRSGRWVAADGQHVFATDRAPRWHHWLAHLDPAWRPD